MQCFSRFWRGLNKREVAALAKEMRHFQLQEGETITRRGEDATFLALLVTGSADVFVKGELVRLKCGEAMCEFKQTGSLLVGFYNCVYLLLYTSSPQQTWNASYTTGGLIL